MKNAYKVAKIKKKGYSSDLNGKDGQLFLHCLRNHEDLEVPYKNLFLSLELVEEMACARNLTEDEIHDFEKRITDFFNLYEECFENQNTTEKTHLLKYHVIDFVKTHKGWGLFSEQGT